MAREAAFAALNPRITRVHGVAKASGASKQVIDDLNTFKRKLNAKRKPKSKAGAAVAADAATPQPKAEREHSSSQLSYDNLVGHVSGYFGVLRNLPSYNPNEADLKLPALHAFADDLRARNDAVSSTFVPLSQARGLTRSIALSSRQQRREHRVAGEGIRQRRLRHSEPTLQQIKGLEFKRSRK